MKEYFFNPDDIQETIIGLKKQHGHSMRSSTNGIPDFVPRRSQDNKRHQAKSTHFVPDIPEQTPPPATNTVFSQADVDEFLARKPKTYKMTERDYKELGKNTLLGIGSLLDGLVTATVICAPVVAGMMDTKNKSDSESESEYRYGSDGTIYKGNAVIFDIENY
ncbi:hypothetical protein CJR92_08245 [Salmonella enterica subsp. enterica serovar Muenchen]|uniref:Uncharacterized protein n=1 Tax=Salmonella enterica TaxID=28901 RepID=A0A5T6KWG4_SALER|nr:hypothetical protein [Salmonella enterica subsp. enterica serovar Muenchen]EAM1814968.1 hypothetical protein [Salmonella enterica]EDQ9754888.1 hypothetical protein [Salmonella enterica subsp. enterica]ELE3241253.1 hypothetical protein [Salmonella enterica subsp. enterica serovar Newport]EAT4590899.1 hypothetical protein [Salmonella enterica]